MVALTRIHALGFFASLVTVTSAGLAADPLAAVKSVRVETLGSKPGAADVVKELDRELRKTAGLQVADAGNADATIRGDCEIWVRGYVSLNPRAGSGPGRGTPIYGGFLSVELRDRQNGVLWSYLATPHAGTADAARDLSRQVARSLKLALEKAARKDHP
jgi:hypothetical protein